MKKYHAFFFLLFFVKGQLAFTQLNLVPNPSFEDTMSCPTMLGQVTKAKFWHDLLNTPDYFNECCVVPQVGVPSNTFGFQYPYAGNSYMGLYNYDLIDTNYREVIGTFLINPLQIGVKYYVNFKVSFSAGIFQAVNIATNKIGILFSTVDYLSAPPPINNFSQIYEDTIISDSLNWTAVRGSFIADSAYSFISIGNFYQNYLTDTINLNTFNHTRAYYYIDALCVSQDSMYSEVWTGLQDEIFQDKIRIFPNPVKNIISIENIPWGCLSIEMYNVNGMKINTISINRSFKTTLDLSMLPDGIYSIIFNFTNSLITKKVIHINN